jgi:iron(III) transport system ATP-binding protein
MYLQLDHLSKHFPARAQTGTVAAVDDLTLSIEKGEFITLLGPSGCGKTTTLRLIAGFELPTAGTISLDGEQINDRTPDKRGMAMVFQSYAIFPHLNVFDNIAYGLRVKNMPAELIRRKMSTVLELTELSGLERREPNQLSGGQQQRVALARALVMEPKVLLFDEPLSNLDAKLREQMRIEIRSIQQRLGITSIYVTHDQVEAMTLSDRIVVMNKGRIEQVGTPQAIYQRPATRFVADFIGKANFVEARVLSQSDGRARIQSLGSHDFQVPCLETAPRPGDVLTLVVRPEAVTVNRDGAIDGVVERASYLGAAVEYEIAIGDEHLQATENDPLRAQLYASGTPVRIGLIAELLYLLPRA